MIEQHIGRIVEDLGLHYITIAFLIFVFVGAIVEFFYNLYRKIFRK